MSSNTPAAQTANVPVTTKQLFAKVGVLNKFSEILGKKQSVAFVASVLQVTQTNALLLKADSTTIYTAALIAATLNLPINQNLGFAWIVPYKGQAQFQMGYKGYVQLAQRTGQYKNINAIEIYANQFVSYNPMTEELEADFSKEGEGEIAGFAATFTLLNGFVKTIFWTMAKVEKHGKKYSQSYNSKFSPWKTDFVEMGKKTLLKNLLSKWGILSVEMVMAQGSDQGVMNDPNNLNAVKYPDNTTPAEDVPHKEIPDAEMFEQIKNGVSLKTTTPEKANKAYDLTDDQFEILRQIEVHSITQNTTKSKSKSKSEEKK